MGLILHICIETAIPTEYKMSIVITIGLYSTQNMHHWL